MTAWAAANVSFREAGPEGTRATHVARARELVPRLAGRAAQAEADRRLADDTIDELADAGLLRILTPRSVGGLGGDIRMLLEIARELACGCGSTAWVATVHNTCAWLVGLASVEAQREVWSAGPDVRVAGVLAPTATARRVAGGLSISGQWSWASGCLHAHWCLVGVPIVDEAGQAFDHGLALVPARELMIVDTWFVAGMRATGSHTLVAEDVFVPEHRLLSLAQLLFGARPSPASDEALQRAPLVPVAALVLVGPLLGLAAAALELVIAEVSAPAPASLPGMTRASSPSVQLALAEAATLVDTAHLHAYRAAADIDDAARSGRTLDLRDRARIRMDAGHAARCAREAVRGLCSARGASCFAESSPLQRMWRDVEVASRHPLISAELASEVYGRLLLGLDAATPLV